MILDISITLKYIPYNLVTWGLGSPIGDSLLRLMIMLDLRGNLIAYSVMVGKYLSYQLKLNTFTTVVSLRNFLWLWWILIIDFQFRPIATKLSLSESYRHSLCDYLFTSA